jgi:transposase
MKELPDLKQLTDSDKDALIQALWDELQNLRTKKPKKTAKNSSLPPAKGFKASLKPASDAETGADAASDAVKRVASVGRAGGGRPLSPTPDQIIVAQLKQCKTCGADLN